jgi:hypothetical protein
MILKDRPLPKIPEEDEDVPSEIFILGFEVFQLSSRAQDLAQCLAELYMAHHSYRAQAPLHVMRGVGDGYHDTNATKSPTPALQITMHFGIHIVVIPWRYCWPRGEKLMDNIRFGYDCLLHGFEWNVEWFKDEPLAPVFSSLCGRTQWSMLLLNV